MTTVSLVDFVYLRHRTTIRWSAGIAGAFILLGLSGPLDTTIGNVRTFSVGMFSCGIFALCVGACWALSQEIGWCLFHGAAPFGTDEDYLDLQFTRAELRHEYLPILWLMCAGELALAALGTGAELMHIRPIDGMELFTTRVIAAMIMIPFVVGTLVIGIEISRAIGNLMDSWLDVREAPTGIHDWLDDDSDVNEIFAGIIEGYDDTAADPTGL
jgi:hypothetical protein